MTTARENELRLLEAAIEREQAALDAETPPNPASSTSA